MGCISAAPPAIATDPSPPPLQTPVVSMDPRDIAIDQATDPLPEKTQLKFKPSYTFPNGDDRYTAELQFEGILPYHGVFIPDLEAEGFWSIARIQLPVESLENSSGSASGFSDLSFVDLAAHRAGPFNIGLGYATVFPMATSPLLGQGKWQLGPAAGLRVRGLDPVKVAFLVQNFYSVAGNSQSAQLGYVTVQPFLSLRLPSAFFFSSDATMNFYWNGGQTSVPVNLGFGRAFSGHFVGTAEAWYTIAGSGQGDWKGMLVMNFQP
jgi:hypothetical protein